MGEHSDVAERDNVENRRFGVAPSLAFGPRRADHTPPDVGPHHRGDDIFTARLKHGFTPDLSVADTFRYAHYDFNYRFDAPNFGDTIPAPDAPLSRLLVGRGAPSSIGVQSNLDNPLDVTTRFRTGFLTHTLVAGLELGRQTSDISRLNNPFNRNTTGRPRRPCSIPIQRDGPKGARRLASGYDGVFRGRVRDRHYRHHPPCRSDRRPAARPV